MKIEFKCSDCGGERIEEIMEGVNVATTIVDIESDGDLVYAGWPENDGGTVVRYQCAQCGQVIPGIQDAAELYAYLAEERK